MELPFLRSKKTPRIGIVTSSKEDGIRCAGYTSLDHCPEVMTAVQTIAEIIGSMTIHLMANTKTGDQRIINELSKKIDIEPNSHMNRSQWIQAIVRTLLLEGEGNAIVIPHTRDGYLEDLEPIAAQRVSFVPIGYSDYEIYIDGRRYSPADVLHFVYNPDPLYPWKGQGIKVSIKDVSHDLKQASATKRGFMESKWKPSFIVRVDGMTDALATPKGRQKLLTEYVDNERAGTPWIIPGEQMSIETVKPLTLKDLAISESVELDKRTVAAIFGEPPFLLGVGEYDQDAWNAFVQNKVKAIALILAQEMTRKLIFSPDWYLRFNILSLLRWDIKTIADVMCTMGDRGYVDGNEARDQLGMSPREGLDELRVLENYIPAAMSGQQSKLVGNKDGGSNDDK